MSDFHATKENREAGKYLEAARVSLRLTQPEFAAALADQLGVALGGQSVRSYEAGRRTVPAAVLIAASRLSGIPFLDPVAEQTLGERLARLERELIERPRLLSHAGAR